ncbi:EamA-like transporter family protein [compost metagenome]
MALFSTVLPVFWQSAAVRRIGAARTVLIGTLGPILTILFGWLLLAEPVSLAQLAGAGLVLAGVWLVSRRNAAPARRVEVADAACAQNPRPWMPGDQPCAGGIQVAGERQLP